MFLANIGFFPRAFCVRPQGFFVIESIQSSVSESPTSWLGWLREGEEGEEGVDVLYQCRKKRLRDRDVSSVI